MDYDRLLEKIDDQPELKKAIGDIANSYGATNLVCKNWKEILYKTDIYKRYKASKIKLAKPKTKAHNIQVRSIVGYENQFHIVVAGYWSLGRKDENDAAKTDEAAAKIKRRKIGEPDSLVCRHCPPLTEIGKVLKFDPNSETKLFDNCKLFINTCSVNACSNCFNQFRNSDSSFKAANNWCTKWTQVFDGSTCTGRFKVQIVEAFASSNFIGIVRLQINQVFDFGEGYKICGNLSNMILFKDQNLEKYNEELLPQPPPPPPPPTLPPYPKEDDEGEEEKIVTCVPDK
ncbi:hypothetical protein RF55_23982 [Lasius niger]|uniref:Uncharacterized protein n=1 Tax=Lasius niger TaxID=67767 RepID=A0A0J7JVA6_LASNI|nr:hypothetical protein RF55_23982 [Lasius niger]